MRCHICNATLGATEVQWNNDHEDWDPCGRCQHEIDEVFNDKSEEEIDEILQLEFEFEDTEGPQETPWEDPA